MNDSPVRFNSKTQKLEYNVDENDIRDMNMFREMLATPAWKRFMEYVDLISSDLEKKRFDASWNPRKEGVSSRISCTEQGLKLVVGLPKKVSDTIWEAIETKKRFEEEQNA